MQPQNDLRPWNVRALLESTATPFAIAYYEPRAAIFRQGDPCDSVMHIEKGRVWLTVTARSGKEAICGLLGNGAFLGEKALVGRGERPHSATAMTATQVLVVAKADMIRLKLYTLYAPPNHRDGVVHHNRDEAEADSEHFDGKTTE